MCGGSESMYIVCVIFDPNFYWHITGDLRFRFLSKNIVQVLLKLRKRNVENKEVNSFLKEHSLFCCDNIMAVRVVEFSNGGYKIRKIFA